MIALGARLRHHVHYMAADEMVEHAVTPGREPSTRCSNELTRATNQEQMENVRVGPTSFYA